MKCPTCGEAFYHLCEGSAECAAGDCPVANHCAEPSRQIAMAMRRARLGLEEYLTAKGVTLDARRVSVCLRCARRWPVHVRRLLPALPAFFAWRLPSFELVMVERCASCAAGGARTKPGRTRKGPD